MFELKPQKDTVELLMAVVIDGEQVGKVERASGCNRAYHAVLSIKGVGYGQAPGIAQGWGNTEREAVMDAFVAERKRSAVYLEALDDLEARIKAACKEAES